MLKFNKKSEEIVNKMWMYSFTFKCISDRFKIVYFVME